MEYFENGLYDGPLIEIEWDHLGEFGTDEYTTNALKWGWHSVVPGVLMGTAVMGFDRLSEENQQKLIRGWEKLARNGVDEHGRGEALIITGWSNDCRHIGFGTISDFSSFRGVYDVVEDAMDELGWIEHGVYINEEETLHTRDGDRLVYVKFENGTLEIPGAWCVFADGERPVVCEYYAPR
ncbi:hypothetical protein SEA_DUMPTRUCK_40 [Gordonia phage DumpTruck]|nr:hypothetical protein SEA_DUMPTRUCK_40 [Gordonia phage DumpTruck]